MRARAYRMTGDGLFILHVQGQTGLVKKVQIERSTGSSILDSSARRALKEWRFKTDALRSLKLGSPQRHNPSGDFLIHMPISFVLAVNEVIIRGRHTGLRLRQALPRGCTSSSGVG
jgi:TonB family protein